MLVIIPAANEENRIEKPLVNLLQKLPKNYSVLVVRNGTDSTPAIIKKLTIKYPNLKLLSFNKPIGKGKALVEGFKQANNRVAFYDADGATPVFELERMNALLDNGADIVIGSRWLPESRADMGSLRRRFASRCFNFLVRCLFSLNYADTQCGTKAFSQRAQQWVNK